MTALSEKPSSLSPAKKALRTFLLVVFIFVVYAFAVEITQVNLETPTQPRRQEQLFNVLRALARPDFFLTDAVTGQITGLSETTKVTLERMAETILMALMASTVGTILAVPVSFLAARNLMEPVTMPLAAIMAAIIAFPVGGWVAGQVARVLFGYAAVVSAEPWRGLVALIVVVFLLWLLLRVQIGGPMTGTTRPSRRETVLLNLRLSAAVLLAFFALGLIAELGLVAGQWLEAALGTGWGFIGNFVFVVAFFIRMATPAVMWLLGGLVAMSWGSHYGQEAVLSWSRSAARLVTAVLTALGVALFVLTIGSALAWLYTPDRPELWTTIPTIIAAGVGAVAGAWFDPKRPFPIGFIIYSVCRTLLNILRSIESLILAIVFVIWVGIGPFAGFMALTFHSIAALGKLFSEQVESISDGPVEAITATGANRIQVIAYAVIPQIIPPYIAFSFYRWDINVRMSTVIGFVGGGGIGFVLSQNIQQLRYQQASVMMLAIALVVSLLDYASSEIRSRVI